MRSTGSFVYIPAGAVHGFRVADRAGKKLNLYVPAMVGYFHELAAAVQSGDVTDEHLGAIAERYGWRSSVPSRRATPDTPSRAIPARPEVMLPIYVHEPVASALSLGETVEDLLVGLGQGRVQPVTR